MSASIQVLGRLLQHDKLQDLMEKPLDGGHVDVEGFMVSADDGPDPGALLPHVQLMKHTSFAP